MYKIFTYRVPEPEAVKFQRLVMGWLAVLSLFTKDINLVYLFFILTSIGIFTGTHYSPISIFYRLFKKIISINIIKISNYHERYYKINSEVDFIDHLLRIIASSSAIVLFYYDLDVIAWGLMAFLSIFMMISAYFGFCLSALTYILIKSFLKQENSSCENDRQINEKCILAKNCFKPYKRCDSCHLDISRCLGTKFNTVIIVIGLSIGTFLFFDNILFIQINIIFIMGLLFWLGYQINYSTDELAESNNTNKVLFQQLKEHNQSLEDEVKKRTSEIEHLAVHDKLTNTYNRYWFEKKVEQAVSEVHSGYGNYIMAFLDLDKFKEVNDSAGHLAGDKMLQSVTNIIQKQINKGDCLARLGGDEFAILFDSNELSKVVDTCNTICKVVDGFRLEWDEYSLHIGVSIGVVTATKETPNMTELFRKADKACYKAKNKGRNRVEIFEDE